MDQFMKDYLVEEWLMEKVEWYMQMVIIILENGMMINVYKKLQILIDHGYGEYYHSDGAMYKGNWFENM